MQVVKVLGLFVGMLLLASCRTGTPDLRVKSIGTPTVSCPTGVGSCVTTVTIEVENVGDADAGAFNIKVTLDPAGSVVVNQASTGLAMSATQAFTLTTPAGGNCFDPDCTISVTVDDLNAVPESDENNNTDSATTIG